MSPSQEIPPLIVPSIADPSVPLTASYTYHSPTPTDPGPYILGVDEAGRGPVLGPMVYGVAYCPASYKDRLEDMGFDDSKALKPETRASLLKTLCSDSENLAWSVRVLSPQGISNGMLRRPPVNLNRQAEQATILLIREVLQSGIQLSEIYVDALGNTETYQTYLSKQFPGINITVKAKADSLFKIVGAASVAAKVTRDAWIEGWKFEEQRPQLVATPGASLSTVLNPSWGEEFGSGYPSDPKTKAWISKSLEPTFGFPSFVRFSWTTVKNELDKSAHAVTWTDEGNESLIKAFNSATGLDKDRCAVAKDLCISSVASL